MPWKPKKTVVVPVDYSNASVDAVRTGIDSAEAPESVHVIHALLDLEPESAYSNWSDDYVKARRTGALSNLEEFLTRNEIQGVQTAVLDGNPGRRIVEYAEECEADLIVMPSHGYHGYKRLVLGSTTERVLRHAHCPVYVLRRTGEDE